MLHLKKFLAKKLSLKDHKDVSNGLFCYLHWVRVSIDFWTVIFFKVSATKLRKRPTFRHTSTGSPQNDFVGRSPEIPYWWRVTTQILVVFLIGRATREIWSTNQKHYPDLDSVTSSVWNFCSHSSDVISRGNHQLRREISAIFSRTLTYTLQDSLSSDY